MQVNSNDPISIIFLKGFFEVINTLRRFKMPEDFLRCVREGGKVITKKIDENRYIHICYDKKGKAHPGEIKYKKRKSK